MHRQGVLDSGRKIAYASGLFVGEYKGLREVQHSGGTAAYRGFLTRFPDDGVAVSVMCNAANANPGRLAHEVADLYLADAISDPAPFAEPPSASSAPEVIARLAGGYRDTRTGQFIEIVAGDGALLWLGIELHPAGDRRFASTAGVELEFETTPFADGRPAANLTTPVADDVRIEPVAAFVPTASDLAAYAGAYHSDEAEVTHRVVVEDGGLAMTDRYGDAVPLEPVYADAFTSRGTTYIFRRNGAGRITGFSLSQGRVWDLRFALVNEG